MSNLFCCKCDTTDTQVEFHLVEGVDVADVGLYCDSCFSAFLQREIQRKDDLLRVSLKMLQGASYDHPYPNAAGGINELIKKIEQEIGDE